MTFWSKFKLMYAVDAVYDDAKLEMKMGKSILKSKTFWANVLGLALQVSGIIDPKYGIPTMAILNIILRAITDSPVTIPGVSQ